MGEQYQCSTRIHEGFLKVDDAGIERVIGGVVWETRLSERNIGVLVILWTYRHEMRSKDSRKAPSPQYIRQKINLSTFTTDCFHTFSYIFIHSQIISECFQMNLMVLHHWLEQMSLPTESSSPTEVTCDGITNWCDSAHSQNRYHGNEIFILIKYYMELRHVLYDQLCYLIFVWRCVCIRTVVHIFQNEQSA